MNKITLLLILLCNTVFISAQENDQKYLAGSVQENDRGKVVFNRTLKVSKDVSEDKLFELVKNWAETGYVAQKGEKHTVLITKENEKSILFESSDILQKTGLFNLNNIMINYHLLVSVELGSVKFDFRNIKYYNDNEPKDILVAEKMITDKVAIHKSGTKLKGYYGDYRTQTIDFVDAVRDSLRKSFETINVEDIKKEEEEKKKTSIVDVD